MATSVSIVLICSMQEGMGLTFGKARNNLAPKSVKTIQSAARQHKNVFEELMGAEKYNAQGQAF